MDGVSQRNLVRVLESWGTAMATNSASTRKKEMTHGEIMMYVFELATDLAYANNHTVGKRAPQTVPKGLDLKPLSTIIGCNPKITVRKYA